MTTTYLAAFRAGRRLFWTFLASLPLTIATILLPQLATPAQAASILCVDGVGGNSVAACSGTTFATIGAAVTAASAGDEIRILDATTFVETLSLQR